MKNGLNDFNIKARQGCAVFPGGTFTAVFKITSFDALYCMDKKMTFCIATILCTRVEEEKTNLHGLTKSPRFVSW